MLSRYLLVGILNTAIFLSVVFICFNLINLNYQLSYLIGYICGIINSFIVNRTYTFRSDSNWKYQIKPFVISILACYLISHFFLIFLVEKILVNTYVAFLFSSILYTTISFILAQKIFKK